jgi:IS30 family transposase
VPLAAARRPARRRNSRPGRCGCRAFPAAPLRTVTRDQETETAATRRPPARRCVGLLPRLRPPWRRGTSENTNGLPRGYFLKGTGLSTRSRKHLPAAGNELNARPGRVLSGQTPAGLSTVLPAPENPSVLRR